MDDPRHQKSAQEEFFETTRPIWRWRAFVFKAKMIYAAVILTICFVIGIFVLLSEFRQASRTQANNQSIPRARINGHPCQVSVRCELASNALICDFDTASMAADRKISNDEVSKRLEKALDSRVCEFSGAGRIVKLEATSNAEVIHLTEGGRHLGYAPRSSIDGAAR